MTSYNRVLNSSPEYRSALLRALVENADLPVPDETPGNGAPQAQTAAHDQLLTLFGARHFDDVGRIMTLQYEKFGPVDEELFWSSVAYVARQGEVGRQSAALAALVAKIPAGTQPLQGSEVFAAWHQLHVSYFAAPMEYFDSLVDREVTEYDTARLVAIFTEALKWSGLHEKGWRAVSSRQTNFISIARTAKQVLVGPLGGRLGRRRMMGLLLHELYIHAMWAEELPAGMHDAGREEGVGTLVEQLSLDTFFPLRMYRFLAIGFAVGIDGVPRNMRQTYKLLLEVRRALKPHEEQGDARLFTAKETVRVFRSLPPDVPGLVYIRDKYYLEHNAAIWGTLAAGQPTPERFAALVAPWKESI